MRKMSEQRGSRIGRSWSIVLCIIIILITSGYRNRNSWFVNLLEPPYSSLALPGRICLTFGNNGAFSRNISWQCGDCIEPSEVVFTSDQTTDTIRIAAEGKILHTEGGTSVFYRAAMTDLHQGIYTYRVCTGTKQSAWYSFAVHSDNDNFAFIYLGDLQDQLNAKTHWFFSDIYRKYSQAAFWVLGGDIVDHSHDPYWGDYFRNVDGVSQSVPTIAAPGNHEYMKGLVSKLDPRFIYTFSYLADRPYQKCAAFDIRYGNTAIITLDSNCNLWMLPSQRAWLEGALKRAADARWKVLVLHHPIYSIQGKCSNLATRMMFKGLIKKYGVDLVLQGHEHNYARMISRTVDNRPTTPVYVISQASYKDYRLFFNPLYDRFGTGLRYYSVISSKKDSLQIRTYTEHDELYDDVCLIKREGNLSVVDLATDIPEHIEITDRTRKLGKDSSGDAYRREIEQWTSRKKKL